jgi:hypothetical protein
MTPDDEASTLTGRFRSAEEARQAVLDLITAGFESGQLSLVEEPLGPAVVVSGVNGRRARAEGILRRDRGRTEAR